MENLNTPWHVSNVFYVRDNEDLIVASVFGHGEAEKSTRARLIAAAPELYALLKEGLEKSYDRVEYFAYKRRGADAIAKVEGEK